MTYNEAKALVKASGTLEGVRPTAIADALAAATSEQRRWRDMTHLTTDDVRVAAAAAYELGKLGMERDLFRSFIAS